MARSLAHQARALRPEQVLPGRGGRVLRLQGRPEAAAVLLEVEGRRLSSSPSTVV